MEDNLNSSVSVLEERLQIELLATFESKRKKIFKKLFGAALGSIPWVGGFISAITEFKFEEGQDKPNKLFTEWLKIHQEKMKELTQTLVEVMKRLDDFPEEINERIESEEYLQIVRKSFRIWDNAETIEKKDLIRKLLTNAGANKLAPDDLIRLFLDWLNIYHEVHFNVIKAIYKSKGITRFEMWQQLNATEVREDSLEADLFKLIIRDLSTGGVIRQHRQTDYSGNFIKKTPRKGTNASPVMKSAFDDQEGYELTELGKQFVHYTLNEVVPRIQP